MSTGVSAGAPLLTAQHSVSFEIVDDKLHFFSVKVI